MTDRLDAAAQVLAGLPEALTFDDLLLPRRTILRRCNSRSTDAATSSSWPPDESGKGILPCDDEDIRNV